MGLRFKCVVCGAIGESAQSDDEALCAGCGSTVAFWPAPDPVSLARANTGTSLIRAKHPPGRSGESEMSPYSPLTPSADGELSGVEAAAAVLPKSSSGPRRGGTARRAFRGGAVCQIECLICGASLALPAADHHEVTCYKCGSTFAVWPAANRPNGWPANRLRETANRKAPRKPCLPARSRQSAGLDEERRCRAAGGNCRTALPRVRKTAAAPQAAGRQENPLRQVLIGPAQSRPIPGS